MTGTCRGFARQSGGQVRICSEVGQGTTVCVYPPRHHGIAEIDEAGTIRWSTARTAIRHLIDGVLFVAGFAENAAVGNGHFGPGMELPTKPFTLEALSSKVAGML